MTQFHRITDKVNKKRYKGRVFLFEKVIVFTQELENGTLEYRGFFDCKNVEISYSQENKKMKIIEGFYKKMKKVINLHADLEVILEWSALLEIILYKNLQKREY